ncbi:S1C family serine protease [Streptacidiphilus griseoplanus]|uniref:S1C family serine protease n=1 Tax=Peterkaempfera griseoplana TaxID=66896 RepID=UPI0006E24C8E|nr:trypsin-like peptidase domain-containing protein [Peterkaempfera griseoplana]
MSEQHPEPHSPADAPTTPPQVLEGTVVGHPFDHVYREDFGAATAAATAPEPEPAPSRGHRARRSGLRGRLVLAAAAAVLAATAGGAAGALVASGHDGGSAVASSTVARTVADRTSAGAPTVAAIAQAVTPSTVEISVRSDSGSATGTGVILTSTGQILTNYHVISTAVDSGAAITVTFSDGSTATATLTGTDKALDVAVIKASGVSGLTPATLGDSDAVAVGDAVVAIGSPEGLTGTVTSGIISAKNRKVTVQVDEESTRGNGGFGYPRLPGADGSSGPSGSSSATATYKALQTDAALNPGNSGGPLINASGQVVGINSAMYSSSGSSSAGGQSGSIGLGFAIPINAVRQVLPQLQAGQTLSA